MNFSRWMQSTFALSAVLLHVGCATTAAADTTNAREPVTASQAASGEVKNDEAKEDQGKKTMFIKVDVNRIDGTENETTQAEMEKVVSWNQTDIFRCYSEKSAADPNFRVMLKAKLNVAPSGAVSSVEIEERETVHEVFDDCVLHQLAALNFPSSDGPDDVSVSVNVLAGHRKQKVTYKGSLRKEEIDSALKLRSHDIKARYDNLLKGNPELKGKIVPQFVIQGDGTVGETKVAQNMTGSKELGLCVLDVIKTIQFPKPRGGGNVLVTYPYTFEF